MLFQESFGVRNCWGNDDKTNSTLSGFRFTVTDKGR
jgi:hypothetical protein